MEFFSFLKKRPSQRRQAAQVGLPAPTPTPVAAGAQSPSPEHVRQLLFDAVAAGDERKLDSLCQEHEAVILRHGEDWRAVPVEFHANPEIRDWYVRGLDAIARYCAEKLRPQELTEQTPAPVAPSSAADA